jgi:D-alanine--poly(phosphoribitol) ligase subunit 2
LQLSKIEARLMNDARTWLAAWFAQRAPDVSLADDDNFFEAEAIDSFSVIELIEDAEQRFRIRFVELDFQDLRFGSIRGLAEIIVEKKASAAL